MDDLADDLADSVAGVYHHAHSLHRLGYLGGSKVDNSAPLLEWSGDGDSAGGIPIPLELSRRVSGDLAGALGCGTPSGVRRERSSDCHDVGDDQGCGVGAPAVSWKVVELCVGTRAPPLSRTVSDSSALSWFEKLFSD